MLERMAEAEQEQQQRAFRPGAERRGAGGRDEHQRIDLELLELQIVDRLAQREEAAEDIGADIEGGRQPVGRARDQLLDREADRQQRAACQREDQLGIRAEEIGVGVVVAIPRPVLIRAFAVIVPGMVAGAVIVSGMVTGLIGASPLAGFDLEPAQCREDRRFVDAFFVIFDTDAARGAGIGLQYAGHLGQGFPDGTGAAFVADPFDLPCHMTVSPADLGACRPHHVAHA